jgi:hypothetical protein
MKTKSDWKIWRRGLDIARKINLSESIAGAYANGYLRGVSNSKKSAKKKSNNKNVAKQNGKIVGKCLANEPCECDRCKDWRWDHR